MKQSWEIKSISDVCEVIAGQSPKGKYYNDKGDGLPFYQGKKLFGEKYLDEPNTWSSVTTKESYAGDIVMSVRAPVGDVNFNYHKIICIGRGLAGIRAGETVNKDYLFYFLIHHKNKIVGNTGAVFNSINKSQIEAIPIPIPPLDEQKRIVAKLDECFEAIDKARANVKRNLNNAKELFQSQLNQIFSQKGDGWVEKKLGEVCEFENGDRGKNYPSRSKFVSEGIPFVNAGHLDNGKVIIENLNYITQENYNLLSRGKFSIGDILFCLRGSLGKYAMIDSLERGAIASSLVIVRVTKELINNFLFYYFDSPICIKMIEEYAGGTAQPNLGAKDLAKFNIPYPPLDEQKRTVAKLDALKSQTQTLESNYQQELDALDELKKSILQKAFNGEL